LGGGRPMQRLLMLLTAIAAFALATADIMPGWK
jgi:hypothetical protein